MGSPGRCILAGSDDGPGGPLLLFNSFSFLAFLVVVLCGAALLRPRPALERWFLILASAFFYGQWSWKYLLLIYLTITVDYTMGRLMGGRLSPRLALWVSLTVNLGILAGFKYADFLLGSVQPGLALLGFEQLSAMEVLLPVGISFYTFQSLSYTIDRYRDQLPPRNSFRDYALFVSFFPQLVAGPIVRASEFFEQLDGGRRIDFGAAQAGFLLIVVGLFKKVVLADNLALMADPVFDDPSAVGTVEAWLGVYAFAFQIYFDFSGYTDIAIGAARLLGFRFPKNFDHPYVALSIREFWRRWHMTLSRWLRDYLYISLGGNRGGPGRTAHNLMLTMLLGGLWHGASWNFVFWGGLHGAYLAFERFVLERFAWWRNGTGTGTGTGPVGRAVRWLVVFHAVCLGWVFFRAADFATAMALLERLASAAAGSAPLEAWQPLLLAGLATAHWVGDRARWLERLSVAPAGRYAAVLATLLAGLAVLAPGGATPFIYFQF